MCLVICVVYCYGDVGYECDDDYYYYVFEVESIVDV